MAPVLWPWDWGSASCPAAAPHDSPIVLPRTSVPVEPSASLRPSPSKQRCFQGEQKEAEIPLLLSSLFCITQIDVQIKHRYSLMTYRKADALAPPPRSAMGMLPSIRFPLPVPCPLGPRAAPTPALLPSLFPFSKFYHPSVHR